MNILKKSLAILLSSLLLSGCGKIDDTADTGNNVSDTSIVSAENTTSAVTSTESNTANTAETTEKTDTTTTVAETTALVTENTTEESTENSEDSENTDNSSTETKKVEIIIDPNMGHENNSVIEQPISSTPRYNQDIKDKLGIEVILTGSNAEQAQQYTNACRAAYPNLPWTCNGTSAGVDISQIIDASGFDAWAEGVTDESVDAIINELLAGRDYHDLSLDELAEIIPYVSRGTSLGVEIDMYFSDLTSRDFVTGGYVVAE